MAELVAQGSDSQQQWRHTLPPSPVTLGRKSTESIWAAPWDEEISRLHATLTWQDGRLLVRKHPPARNPIIFRGEERDEFTLAVGERFLIGKTTFLLQESEPAPLSELTCSHQELRQLTYADAGERVEMLAELPGVIRHSPSDEQLEARVVEVLLRGIRRAEAAAVVRLDLDSSEEDPQVEVRCTRGRSRQARPFQPSRQLILRAVRHRRQSVLHVWAPGGQRATLTQDPTFDQDPSFDWALCVPLPDKASAGWGLCVAGRVPPEPGPAGAPPHPDLLKGDLKFAELVADIFGALRQVLDQQRHLALLRRFLPRPVLTALAGKQMDVALQPRLATITVLFCDLRGSCRIAEEEQEDLPQLWQRVSGALDIMARTIIDQGGVIGDFQGDAAMGFWGWPEPCADQVERAARAALIIRRHLANAAGQPGSPLDGFTCGIGIAHGKAIAGRLGTIDQFKVDVFGHTVNLAARLESLTKFFRVPILVDDRIADQLAGGGNRAWCRCRRLVRVRPQGMKRTEVMVGELLPPEVEPETMSDVGLLDYEAAREAFLAGRWDDARQLLRRLPGDGPGEVLMDFMTDHRTPPADWDGVIAPETK